MTDRRTFLATAAGAAAALAAPRQLRATASHGVPNDPQPKSLKILILGGTGLTGPHQVKYALERGHQVTVFNRGRRNDRLPKGVMELKGDRNTRDVAALKGKEWDVVIDNPTSLPFWVKDVGEILKDHTARYIFISTISVYDPAGQTTITEESPLMRYTAGDPVAVTTEQFNADVANLYGPMKAASEAESRKWFGDRATIIRPGLIVGPGDASFRFGYWPWRIAKGGEVLAPGDGTDPIQIIDARDIAEWTIRAAEQGSTGTFNATGPRSTMTMAEQLHGIRGALSGDLDVRFTWVPSAFLAQQQVAPWSEMPTWIPSSDPESVIAKTNITRALAAGLTFRSLATTTVDGMAWFNGLSEAGRTQVSRSAGLPTAKEEAVLAAWRAQKK